MKITDFRGVTNEEFFRYVDERLDYLETRIKYYHDVLKQEELVAEFMQLAKEYDRRLVEIELAGATAEMGYGEE